MEATAAVSEEMLRVSGARVQAQHGVALHIHSEPDFRAQWPTILGDSGQGAFTARFRHSAGAFGRRGPQRRRRPLLHSAIANAISTGYGATAWRPLLRGFLDSESGQSVATSNQYAHSPFLAADCGAPCPCYCCCCCAC